jgi:hypothetical protein
MLYLESPAGVGFSYSANTSFYDSVNDELTGFDFITYSIKRMSATKRDILNRYSGVVHLQHKTT